MLIEKSDKTMNWFKKQINKLFDNDDIDDEEYYEEEFYEEQIGIENKKTDNQMENENENDSKRKSFKFPLIADEEAELPAESAHMFNLEEQNRISNKFEEVRRDSRYFYQPNAITKVYDVEVSGIRDLLEKRQRIKGHSTVINRQESTKIRRVERVKNSKEPIKKEFKNTAEPIKRNNIEQEDPLVPKRRFVPTQVPSPVYGFKKPSNIDQLLSKKHGKVEAKSIDEAEEIENHKTEADSKVSHHENKAEIEATFSESIKANEEVVSTSVEINETFENQNEVVELPSPKQEAPNTSFIEIEDEAALEVEEQTIDLQKELYEKVEEFPILAEAVESSDIEEVDDVPYQQPIQAGFQSYAEQEAAVSVYEAEPIGSPEVIDMHEIDQDEFQNANALDGIGQQNDRNFEEVLKTEPSIDEEDGVSEERPNEIGQANEEIINQVTHGAPSDAFVHSELESIQSTQVQKLVSIALMDSELEEETKTQEELGQVEAGLDARNFEIKEINDEEIQVSEIPDFEEKLENPADENEDNIEEEPEPKGSKLPFNVLMLKSDKEKYAAKLAQKQTLQHNDDYKEMHRHTTMAEEVPKWEQHLVDAQANTPLPQIDLVEEKQENPTMVIQEEEQNDEMLLLQNRETVSLQEEIEETSIENAADDQEVKSPPKIYIKPSLEFLSPPEEKTEDRDWLESQADALVESLSYFQVTAQVEAITQGPAVTQFEITVGHGTKVSKIRNLSDDLKLALAAKDIRIQAPIPGKSTIGIEIPNRISRAVQLSEVTCSDSFKNSESPLEAALGLDLTGEPVTIDLRKMPHGLIAGATGSGKSVCINSILISLLYKANPNELKLMLIDPKMVELAPFNHIPHLVSPVITDVKAATAALKWAVEEMERRYQLFAHVGVRDLPRYNKLADSKGEHGHKLPYILIVIDELADLMMMSPADVEEAICRIAQKARACGIHLIVATQRPSVDVITGLIKSNIPTRIAFAVSSQVDSRTILDTQGAERLLGRGDMLYLGNGMSDPIRLQGTFVTDDEIEEIIEHVRSQGEPDYFFQQDELLKKTEMVEEQDELFEEVCRFVHEQGTASTSSIQRKYHIGYNRAARLIDMLESQGYISEQRGSKPREVYITDSDLTSMFE